MLEQAADESRDHALVADHAAHLRARGLIARRRPNSRVRSWIDRKSELAMPNREITRHMASRTDRR